VEETNLLDTSIVIKYIIEDRLERLPGKITIYTAIEYPPSIKRVDEVIYPSREDYLLAIKWQTKLRKIGKPLPAVDLVIAAIALNNSYRLITRDKHFKYIKEIEPNIRFEIID